MQFKDIDLGNLIFIHVTESGIEMSRICNFLKCSQQDVEKMYQSKSLDTDLLLKWSKLLEYDFFRLYSQHLILYAPHPIRRKVIDNAIIPQFRKNIYTREIIDFVLEQITTGEMTKNQVLERYNIPKTTLYKWISKYSKLK